MKQMRLPIVAPVRPRIVSTGNKRQQEGVSAGGSGNEPNEGFQQAQAGKPAPPLGLRMHNSRAPVGAEARPSVPTSTLKHTRSMPQTEGSAGSAALGEPEATRS